MFPPLRSVNTPVDAELAPIVAPSIVPPLISAVSATKESICAVPSMNRSCHSLSDVPRSLAPSVSGTRSLTNLPPTVMASLVALPRFTSPYKFVLASNVAVCGV